MKKSKFISVFLVLSLLCSIFSVPASANALDNNTEPSNEYIIYDGQDVIKIVILDNAMLQYVNDVLVQKVENDSSNPVILKVTDYNYSRSGEATTNVKYTDLSKERQYITSINEGQANTRAVYRLGTARFTARGLGAGDPVYNLSITTTTTKTLLGDTTYQMFNTPKTIIEWASAIAVSLLLPAQVVISILQEAVNARYLILSGVRKIVELATSQVWPIISAEVTEYETAFSVPSSDPVYGSNSYDEPNSIFGRSYYATDINHPDISGIAGEEGRILTVANGNTAEIIYGWLYTFPVYTFLGWA